jgi:hypothetical protein
VGQVREYPLWADSSCCAAALPPQQSLPFIKILRTHNFIAILSFHCLAKAFFVNIWARAKPVLKEVRQRQTLPDKGLQQLF